MAGRGRLVFCAVGAVLLFSFTTLLWQASLGLPAGWPPEERKIHGIHLLTAVPAVSAPAREGLPSSTSGQERTAHPLAAVPAASTPAGKALPSSRPGQADVRDWRPAWAGPVEADARGLGSRMWQELQPRSEATAADAARQLLAAAARRNSTLAVVQVGACDGAWEETNDPMQALLPDARVRAVLLEPVPPLWEDLRRRVAGLPGAERRLEAVNAAVCLEAKEAAPFFIVSARFASEHPEAQHWARRELGSFDRRHLKKHRVPDRYIEMIRVPCVTPRQLFERQGLPVGSDPAGVDALVVDAEGLDSDLVLAFLELPAFRPALVIFEQTHLPRAKLAHCLGRLRRLRYVHWQEKAQIVAVLAAPPTSASDPSA